MDLLDAKDVKRILKCSSALVYQLANRGQIPCVRWQCPGGGTEKPRTVVRFKQEDIENFIKGHYG